jgi:hypothetical protein
MIGPYRPRGSFFNSFWSLALASIRRLDEPYPSMHQNISDWIVLLESFQAARDLVPICRHNNLEKYKYVHRSDNPNQGCGCEVIPFRKVLHANRR